MRKSIVFALVAAGIIAISALGFYVFDEKHPASSLFGTLGILPFATTVATLAFVAFNASITQRQVKLSSEQLSIAEKNLANTAKTLRQSREAEIISRFQRASELLHDNQSLATRTAGVMLLSEIARVNPKRYYNAVLNLLIIFAEQQTLETWRAVEELKGTHRGNQQLARPDVWKRAFTRTPEDVLAAVRAVGEIRSIKDWERYERDWLKGQKLRLKRVVLCDQTLMGGNYSGMVIENGMLWNMTFLECRLVDTTINNATMMETSFRECDMRRCGIATDNSIDTPDGDERRLSFSQNCDLTGAEIETGEEYVIAHHCKAAPDEPVFKSTDPRDTPETYLARQNIVWPDPASHQGNQASSL